MVKSDPQVPNQIQGGNMWTASDAYDHPAR